MKRLLPALAAFSIAALVIGWHLVRPNPMGTVTVDTSGHEEPIADALFENGWNVANVGDATILDAYRSLRPLMGEPLSAFDGVSQWFRGGRLSFDKGQLPDWQIQLDNLGAIDLQIEGYTPTPGASPHPVLRDWLMAQIEAGLDAPRMIGPWISPAMCDRAGRCCQWSMKQKFCFYENGYGDSVQRQPLGLWLRYPSTRPVASTGRAAPSEFSVTEILLVLVSALIGFVLVVRSRISRRTGSSIPV